MEVKKDTTDYKPLSIFQWILLQCGQTAVQYPVNCHICGKPIKGNILIGFRHTCRCEYRTERGVNERRIGL